MEKKRIFSHHLTSWRS